MARPWSRRPARGVGGRYRLSTVTPFCSIQPPSLISLSRMNCGSPGAQVICSTGACLASQALARIVFCSPVFSLSTGWPSLSNSGTGGSRALTRAAGQKSPAGM